MTSLNPGDKAPDFSMPTDGAQTVTLSDFKGKSVVLFFYPKDDTPGCTKEAIGFSGKVGEFEAAGAVVIGVSKDTAAKHGKFRTKHDLKVILASDAEGDVCERYGVWKEKSMYGRTYWGIERTSFLIGPDGRIVKVWPKVKVAGHAEEVLDAVKD